MNHPHYLVCVEKPNEDHGQQWIFWRDFLKSLEKDQKLSADADRVADNIWLFPATSKLTSLLAFLALARAQLPCKIFFLESAPKPCE